MWWIVVVLLPYFGEAKTVGDVLKQMQKSNVIQQQKKRDLALPSSSTKFTSPTQRSQIDLKSVSPPQTNRIYSADNAKRKQLESIVDKGIQQLYSLVNRYQKSANRGELWLRLAELYVEKASFIEMAENAEFDYQSQLYRDKKRSTRPVLSFKASNAYLKKAIELYEYFLKDFPKDPKVDQALFFLGFSHTRLGAPAKGAAFYSNLLKGHPRSSYVQEAQFALAEYQFERSQFAEAFTNYRSAFQKKNARVYALSKYKGAWSLFRSGRYKPALDLIDGLIQEGIRETSKVSGLAEVNTGMLTKQILKDYIVFYGEAGSPKAAVGRFDKLFGKDAFDQLVKLAYYYSDRGYKEQARATFTYLINKQPTNPQAFDWKYQIVTSYAYAAEDLIFRKELYGWVSNFGPSSSWAVANAADTELIKKSNDLRESTLRNYVLTQHKSAQVSRAKFAEESAVIGYRLYLQEFPTSEKADEMRFYLADILFESKQYKESAQEYMALIEKPNFSLSDEAHFNLLLALEKNLPDDKTLAANVDKRTDKVPMGPEVQAFVTAGQKFVQTTKQKDKRTEVQYKVARLYYFHNIFEESDTRFMDVIESAPQSKMAEAAANLLLDSLNLRNDYEKLPLVAAKLAAMKGLDPSIRKDVSKVAESAEFKRAESFVLAGKPDLAAASFSQIADKLPIGHDLRFKARYNAGVNHLLAVQPVMAEQQIGLLLKERAKGPSEVKLQEMACVELAKLKESQGKLNEAANYLLAAANLSPTPKASAPYILNAGLLQISWGLLDTAKKTFDKYLTIEKSQAAKEQTLLRLARYAELVKDSRAPTFYRNYIDSGATREGMIEAKFYSVRGRGPEVIKLATDPGLRKDPEINARIKTIQLKKRLSEFQGVSIPSNLQKQAAVVNSKLKELASIKKDIGDIIAINNKRGVVEALMLLGDLNLIMFRQLKAVRPPSNFSPEEKAQFLNQLSGVAQPYQTEATQAYIKALERAQDLQVYGGLVLPAVDNFSTLDPTRRRPQVRDYLIAMPVWSGEAAN